MEEIIDQVQRLAHTADDAARKKMVVALRDLSYSLESSDDTMERIMFYHLQIAAVRVGIDLKLFDRLAASSTPLTVDQLSEATGAHPTLLGRLLRYFSSLGTVTETGKDTFGANNVTRTLGDANNQAGVHHYFDFVGPIFQELPAFLRKTGFQDITDNTKTVFQDAWKTDEIVFQFFPKLPEQFNYFNQHMAARRHGMPTWLSVYPVEKQAQGWSPEAGPIFVDIGGGIGHQCAEFKAKYPNLPGSVVLQDLPHCIDHALPTPGVQNMVYDIFKPQPIKGAKFYYMRCVLHDFPDDKCQLILKNIIDVLAPDSLILIDDMVLPNTGVYWQTTQMDLTMMAGLAARERTHEQWTALLDSVGLKIVDIHVYTPLVHESVITCVPK
ncbi:hypothetical protein VTN77DRAFT_3509 [Rasamsonia byssochlamydoides]|uniref:uncharacterized protein n=1 Tax=Rasamsonia byssochlamydoides TaxID=89139 RepID=UPI003743A97F